MRLMHKGERGRSATRALLQLLLLVLALTAFEYLFQGSLESSLLKTHPYKLIYNATQPSLRIANNSETWLKPTTENSTTAFHAKNATIDKTEPTLSLCPKLPPDLGPVQVNKTNLELDFVEKKYPEIKWGGHYAPPNCTARDKVAIIVPYRDRPQHLAIFLNHMHPFLMKQQIEYGIFVIEQDGNKEFNRAKLMNIGFVESQRLDRGWQCFVFHDVDLLPLDTRNLYSCPRQPRHMSANIDAHKHKLKYDEHFGGVSAVTREQFRRVNGFSNRYWGWGSEDDDMFFRLKKLKYHVARYKMSIARYTMLHHKKSVPNPKRIQLFLQAVKTFRNATNGRSQDGLSTLEYTLDRVVQYHLYTYVLANIQGLSERVAILRMKYNIDALVSTLKILKSIEHIPSRVEMFPSIFETDLIFKSYKCQLSLPLKQYNAKSRPVYFSVRLLNYIQITYKYFQNGFLFYTVVWEKQ